MNVMAIAPDPKQIFCFDSACGEAEPKMEVAIPGDPPQNPVTRVPAGRTGFRLIVNARTPTQRVGLPTGGKTDQSQEAGSEEQTRVAWHPLLLQQFAVWYRSNGVQCRKD